MLQLLLGFHSASVSPPARPFARHKGAIVLDLIELYENEPVLWDPNHSSYRDKRESDEAWKRLSEELSGGHDVDFLKDEVASLKAIYRKVKRAKADIHSSHHISYIPESQQEYYNKLDSFLGKTSTSNTRNTSTDVKKKGDVDGAEGPKPEDACGLYGKLLAEKLRLIPERERMTLMHEIDGIVFRRLPTK